MPPTPQQFCADCHTDLRARLPDTRLADASDFASGHPEFQPLVLVRWNGEQPHMQRVALEPASARDEQPQIPARAPSRSARRRGPDGAAPARPLRLRRQPANAPTATCRPRTAPASSRSTWSAIAACATASPSTRSAAPCAPCATARRPRCRRHPLASTAPAARSVPPELSAGARGAAGRRRRRSAPRSSSPAPAPGSAARRSGGARGLLAGRRLLRLPRGGAPPPGTLNYGIRPVAFPTRYMLHGWFDHRQHQIVQRPGQPRLEGTAACASCHGARTSNSASDLLLPDLASCRACHGGERTGRRSPRPARCAMIIT